MRLLLLVIAALFERVKLKQMSRVWPEHLWLTEVLGNHLHFSFLWSPSKVLQTKNIEWVTYTIIINQQMFSAFTSTDFLQWKDSIKWNRNVFFNNNTLKPHDWNRDPARRTLAVTIACLWASLWVIAVLKFMCARFR